MKFSVKAISIFLVLAFLCQEIAWAWPDVRYCLRPKAAEERRNTSASGAEKGGEGKTKENGVTPKGQSPATPTIEEAEYGMRNYDAFYVPRRTFKLSIAGRTKTISDLSYISIKVGDKIIYIATEHNAAYLFTVLSYQQGILNGTESFAHIDLWEHPDNDYTALQSIALPAPDDDIARHLEILARNKVGIFEYVSAIKLLFPQMRFVFLNDKRGHIVTFGGMDFEWHGPLNDFRETLINGIASVDIDIHTESHDHRALNKKLAETILPCKLIMIFISPRSISSERGIQYTEELIENLLSRLSKGELKNGAISQSVTLEEKSRSQLAPVASEPITPSAAPVAKPDEVESLRPVDDSKQGSRVSASRAAAAQPQPTPISQEALAAI